MPTCLPMLTSLFGRFLMGFCSQLRPPEPHGSSPRCSESTIYLKIAFRNLYRFFIDWCQHASIFAPKIQQNRFKNLSWKASIFDRFWHRFFIDFCSILKANLAPCWRHFRSKWGEKSSANRLFCLVYVLFRFFGRPGPPLAPFGLDLGGSEARFWKVFGLYFGSF